MKSFFNKLYYPEDRLCHDDRGRVYFYDNLRFILITIVLMRHLFFRIAEFYHAHPFTSNYMSGIATSYLVFLWFLMPSFIFVTGFYAKNVFKDKKFKISRVVLFLVLFVLMKAILYLTNLIIKGHANFDLIHMSDASWYLFACAVWFLFIPILKIVPAKITMPIIIVLAIVLGYLKIEPNFLAITKLYSFFPFFALGYYLKNDIIEKIISMASKVRMMAFVFFIAFFVFVSMNFQTMVHYVKPLLEINRNYYAFASYIDLNIAWLVRIGWLIACIFVSAVFLLIVPRNKMFWTKFGGRTLQIYIWHSVLVRILEITPIYAFFNHIPVYLSHPILIILAILLSIGLSFKPLNEPFGIITKLITKIPSVKF